jgi:hypothetical protein
MQVVNLTKGSLKMPQPQAFSGFSFGPSGRDFAQKNILNLCILYIVLDSDLRYNNRERRGIYEKEIIFDS